MANVNIWATKETRKANEFSDIDLFIKVKCGQPKKKKIKPIPVQTKEGRLHQLYVKAKPVPKEVRRMKRY